MDQICPHCGFHSPDPAPRFCSSCGARMDGSIPPGLPGTDLLKAFTGQDQKNPAVAGFCSSVLPGLGQVYNGEVIKGYLLFLLTLVGLVAFILPGLFVWLYATYDAYSVAGKMNTGGTEYRPAPVHHMALFILVAIVLVFVLLFLVIAAMISLLTAQLGPDGTRYLNSFL